MRILRFALAATIPRSGWGSVRRSEFAMANQQQINVSPAADEDRAIATITTAFSSDPVVRWVFRDANSYLTVWPPFVKAFAGGAFAEGTADSIDDYGGVAMWLPPGAAADGETMGALVLEAGPADERDEVFAFLAQ